MTVSGLVFNIQKFSVHDGPGIRTLVFLKGCPLRCQWCSNPEGIDGRPTLAFNIDKCLTTDQCQRCLNICPQSAIESEALTRKIKIDREKCDLCGDCVKACPPKAINLFGTLMSVAEVMSIVEQDELFYTSSGGGLTLGGGEPLFQPEFARELLRTAQSYGLETAIETSGLASWSNFEGVVQYCDVVLFDIKSLNSEKHKAFTGVSNRRILDNLEQACRKFVDTPICVRIPVIPGFNDSEEDIGQIISYLKKLPRKVEYELLAYHQFGENKYSMIGNKSQTPVFQKSDQHQFEALQKIVHQGEI